MKKLLIAGVLSGTGWIPLRAQSVTGMVEQLVELQALESTVQQGYKITTDGLHDIGGIMDAEYGLHSAYFGSFDAVNPALTTDPRVLALEGSLEGLIDRIEAELDYWLTQPAVQH
jgi:hypothetical protein